MSDKPITQSGLRTRLTKWRVIEASPMYRMHRWNKAEEMKAFWDRYPFPETSEKLFRGAWKSLVDWYLSHL